MAMLSTSSKRICACSAICSKLVGVVRRLINLLRTPLTYSTITYSIFVWDKQNWTRMVNHAPMVLDFLISSCTQYDKWYIGLVRLFVTCILNFLDRVLQFTYPFPLVLRQSWPSQGHPSAFKATLKDLGETAYIKPQKPLTLPVVLGLCLSWLTRVRIIYITMKTNLHVLFLLSQNIYFFFLEKYYQKTFSF